MSSLTLKEYHERRIKQRLRGTGELARRIFSPFTVQPTNSTERTHDALDPNQTYLSQALLDHHARTENVLPTTHHAQKRTLDEASHTSKRSRSDLGYSGVSHALDEFMDSGVPRPHTTVPTTTVSAHGYAVSSQVGLVTPDRDHVLPPLEARGSVGSVGSFRSAASSVDGPRSVISKRDGSVAMERAQDDLEAPDLDISEAIEKETLQLDETTEDVDEIIDDMDEATEDQKKVTENIDLVPVDTQDHKDMKEVEPTDGQEQTTETDIAPHSDTKDVEDQTNREKSSTKQITKDEKSSKADSEDTQSTEITQDMDSVHLKTSDEKGNTFVGTEAIEAAMMDLDRADEDGYEEEYEQPAEETAENTVDDEDPDVFRYTEEELLTKVMGLEKVRRTPNSKKMEKLAKMHTDTIKRECTIEMRQAKNSTQDVLGCSVIVDFHAKVMETLDERTEDFLDFIEYSDVLRQYRSDAKSVRKRQFEVRAETIAVDRRIEKLKQEIAAAKKEMEDEDAIDTYLRSVKQIIYPVGH